MATLDVKFSKFDNRPWGFRLAGGSDFPEPLTVIRVSEGSLAECMGLKVGDVIVKINDQHVCDMTHGQAHEALTLAGNNFVLGVRRTEDPLKAIEGIEEKIEPYMRPIEEILFCPIEELKRDSTPDEAPQIEDEVVPVEQEETEQQEVEVYPEKPRDENSEKIANTNLTDEEIAQLILDEEEVLNDKGVLGINFNKIRPRAPLFKQSKVFQELVKEVSSEPAQVQELKRQTTFLQKPERPVPKPRTLSQSEEQSGEPEPEPYRVVIKKQPKKSVTERLLERGLIEPSRVKTPDPSQQQQQQQQEASEKTTPAATPEPTTQAQDSEAGSRPQSRAEVTEISESAENPEQAKADTKEQPPSEPKIEEPGEDEEDKPVEVVLRRPSKAEVDVEVAVKMDRDKIKELVTTEISLERQLASVQSQLMALKQLPSEIEKHLKIVTDQLHKIMELSGVDQVQIGNKAEQPQQQQQEVKADEEQQAAEEQCQYGNEECQHPAAESEDGLEWHGDHEDYSQISDIEEGGCSISSHSSSYPPHLMSTESTWTDYGIPFPYVKQTPDTEFIDTETIEQTTSVVAAEDAKEQSVMSESKELEISVKSNEEDGKRVKKYIVSYESMVLQETQQRQRDPSPADSQRSFEANPNLTLQDQLVQEFKHRKGRKRSRDLWQPQAKQLELTYGRKWRCPNDFFNDDMIADVLSSQAEVIRGRAMGVNFKKFEKTALPNYDHLMNSSVYKMIHKMDVEPKKGIPARPPKVIAAEDIIERVSTPVCCMANDNRTGCH